MPNLEDQLTSVAEGPIDLAVVSGIANLQTTDGVEVPSELALSVLASLQLIPDDSPTQHADGTPL